MSAKSFESFTQILNHIIRYFKWVVAAAVILALISCIYQVEDSEVAVVLRFGRLVGNTRAEQIKYPGVHLSFPFFIDEIIRIPAYTLLEKEISVHYSEDGVIPADFNQNGYLITGDRNIALIKVKVIYRISDPVQYAFYNCRICKPEDTVEGIISGELTRLAVYANIDSILTSGNEKLTIELAESSQAILDELQTGIELTSMELAGITTPSKTRPYFEEVINAFVKKETVTQQAKESASVILLSAETQANDYKQNAVHAQSAGITEAQEEIAEFNGLYEQYIKNKQIITTGIFRQRASAILAKMGGSVIIPESGSAPVIILP